MGSVKAAGAVCVLLGAFLARWVFLRERRRRRDTLGDLSTALGRMAEEIRLVRMPLPGLLARLALDCGEEAGGFLRTASLGLRRGEADAWVRAAADLPLSAADQRVLGDLGSDLRGDEERVRRAATAAAERLRQSADAMDAAQHSDAQRVTALSFSAGALLVILLY